jgi:Domain of unknown function (DUF1707)
MDDRMRVSDADRERVTARLREHFAEGRLTQDELNERITATLGAKTFGDLRQVMADLPDSDPAGTGAGPGRAAGGPPPWANGPVYARRRGPRLLPLFLFLFLLVLILPSAGWVFFGILKIFLLLWLVACVAGIFTAFRIRRRVRRHWRSGEGRPGWGEHGWGEHGWGEHGWGEHGWGERRWGGPGSGRRGSTGDSNPWRQDPDD